MLWLADDEVTHLGMPLLLERVPVVERAAVERHSAPAVRAIKGGGFDAVVLPLARCAEVFLQVLPDPTHAKVLAYLDNEDVRKVGSFTWRHAVHGYLLRQDITVATLSGALERLLSGGTPPVPPTVVRALLTEHETSRSPPHGHGADHLHGHGVDTLTQREHTVLTLLLKGLSNHAIARSMGISVHGVKRHVSNLLIKFGCSNRTEVALAATRLGITPSP